MKRWLSLFVLLLSFLSVTGQDIKTVFIAMPDSLTPLLTKVNKEDCIDFLASNMKAEVKNRFDKTAEMKILTEDYLHMQMTENSTLEMKLLPLNDSVKVVCVVKTVCASACDSEIQFYSTDWKQKLRTADFLKRPTSEDFILSNEPYSEEYELYRKKLDMHLMKASLGKDELSITFEYTTPDYLNSEDQKKLSAYLRKEPLVFLWKEGKFE